MKEVKNFYKNLFSQTKNGSEPQLDETLKKLNTVKFSEDETRSLEKELSIEEISQALKQMKNGKSPGIDGFPFLKLFGKKLRPIFLLSYVYKILSSAVANRLKKVLNKLVSKTQTGFISGRYIGENVWLVYDLLHYTEKREHSWFDHVGQL